MCPVFLPTHCTHPLKASEVIYEVVTDADHTSDEDKGEVKDDVQSNATDALAIDETNGNDIRTDQARGKLCGRWEEAQGLRLVLCEATDTEARRGRNTSFTAGRCGVCLDVHCLTKGCGQRLDDGGTSRRLLDE